MKQQIKLAQDGQHGRIHTIADADINQRKMTVRLLFADGNRIDGVGDLLEIGGIDVSRHRMNPVVLFDHGKTNPLPIAKAEDPQGRYTVELDVANKQAWCTAWFYQGNTEQAKFSEQIFDMVVKGYLRGASIGYQVLRGSPMPYDYSGQTTGTHLLRTLMLECSVVVMPANADTVIEFNPRMKG